MSDLFSRIRSLLEPPPPPRGTATRRPLENADYDSWDAALDSRASKPVKPRTVQDLQALLRNRNPVRWRRLRSDYKWVQKEMKKMGLNPEDARYVL